MHFFSDGLRDAPFMHIIFGGVYVCGGPVLLTDYIVGHQCCSAY